MLEAVCCSQAVQGAAKCLLVHLLSASSWAPVPRSHASPFHCCSSSPLLVTEHLFGRREGATSVPCHCLYIPPPHPLWQLVGAFLITPITQDENNAEKTSPSQVIIANMPGSLPLQLA